MTRRVRTGQGPMAKIKDLTMSLRSVTKRASKKRAGSGQLAKTKLTTPAEARNHQPETQRTRIVRTGSKRTRASKATSKMQMKRMT